MNIKDIFKSSFLKEYFKKTYLKEIYNWTLFKSVLKRFKYIKICQMINYHLY